MRFRGLLAAAVLALAACDAGHRDPGSDNLLSASGPTVSFASPREGQTIEGKDVWVMLDVRDASLARAGESGRSIRVVLDDRPPVVVTDATRPFRVAKDAAAGDHTLTATLVEADGSPVAGASASARVKVTTEDPPKATPPAGG